MPKTLNLDTLELPQLREVVRKAHEAGLTKLVRKKLGFGTSPSNIVQFSREKCEKVLTIIGKRDYSGFAVRKVLTIIGKRDYSGFAVRCSAGFGQRFIEDQFPTKPKAKPSKSGIPSFGRRLREVREIEGMSQGDLGFLVDQSGTQISSYENGRSKPSLDKLAKLVGALGEQYALYLLGLQEIDTE